MQDIKSTLYITFEYWFATVAQLLVGLFSFQDSLASSDNLVGKLRFAEKSCENISGYINWQQSELPVFLPEVKQRIIPDWLG